MRNQYAIELMRAITREASPIGGLFSRAGLDVESVDWPRDPHATTQRAVVELLNGTWVTVTVEQHQEKPS
jgi:hypothetical protein